MGKLLPGVHRNFDDRGVRGVQRFVADFAAIQLLEQIRQVGRDQINDVRFQRLFGGDGDAFAHGGHGPFDVAMPFVGDGLREAWRCRSRSSFSSSSSVFSTSPPAPSSTGCAAPMRVCGAIAATSAAMVMNTPALPARAGAGAT